MMSLPFFQNAASKLKVPAVDMVNEFEVGLIYPVEKRCRARDRLYSWKLEGLHQLQEQYVNFLRSIKGIKGVADKCQVCGGSSRMILNFWLEWLVHCRVWGFMPVAEDVSEEMDAVYSLKLT